MASYNLLFMIFVLAVLTFVLVWLFCSKRSSKSGYEPTFSQEEIGLMTQDPQRWWDKSWRGRAYDRNPELSGMTLSIDNGAIRGFPLTSIPLPAYYPVASTGKYARNIPTTPYTVPDMEFTSADIQNFPWNASYFDDFGDIKYPYGF